MPAEPDSERKRVAKFLYGFIHHEKALFRAWQFVRSRALNSTHPEIQSEAREFDARAYSRVRSIADRLRRETFQFAPQKAVLKKRSGKAPRGILVAPIDSRVVLRAMLDLLVARCPSVRELLKFPFTVGGIEGADVAIALAMEHMRPGKSWYVRSDIPSFFNSIPRKPVLSFITDATDDSRFVDLFGRAMETELGNPEAVKDHIDVFPVGDRGVAQGSALSPLIGNILLRDFDRLLNDRGIVCIRYIDDFLIIGPSKKATTKAFENARKYLKDLGLEAYSPWERSDKASMGLCDEGFIFLGCRLVPGMLEPSPAACRKLIEKVDAALDDGRKGIQRARRGSGKALVGQRYVQTLARVDRIIQGWGEAFAFCNRRQPLDALDHKIDERLTDFRKDIRRKIERAADSVERRRILGVCALADIKPRALGARKGKQGNTRAIARNGPQL